MSAAPELLLFTVAFKIEGEPLNGAPLVVGRMPLKLMVDEGEVSWSVTLFPFDPVIAIGAWHIGLAQTAREATGGWHLGRALDLVGGGQWVGPVGQRVGSCVLLEQTFLPPTVMHEDWLGWREKWERLGGGSEASER